MKVAEAFVEVRGDTSKLEGDVQAGAESAGKKASVSLGQVLSVAAVGAGLQKTIDSASDLNETVNVTGLVFAEAADEVGQFAKEAEQGLGLSERAAREALNGFGGMLQNLGFVGDEVADLSKQLTTLSADLGSAFNTDTSDAAEAISAALRGENEQIQRYNVFLNDAAIRQEAVTLGLAQSTAQVDGHAKAQATLSLILQQTTKYQGDFANTSDGVANSQKRAAAAAENASADLGKNFLPIYQKVVDVVGLAAQGFGAIPAPVQTATVALAGIAALVGPVRTGLEGLKTVGQVVGAGFDKAAIGAFNLAGGLPSLATSITGIGTVAGIAGVALFSMAQDAERTKRAAKELREEAEATGKSLKEAVVDQLIDTFSESHTVESAMDDLGVSFADLRKPLTGSKDDLEAWGRALIDSAEGKGSVASEHALELVNRVRDLNKGLHEAERQDRQTATAKEELGVATKETAEKTGDLGEASGELEDYLKAQREETERATKALDDLYESTVKQFGADIQLAEAQDKTEDALREVEEAAAKVREGKGKDQIANEVLKRSILDAEQALLDQGEAAVKAAEAQAALAGKTLDAHDKAQAQIVALTAVRDTLDPKNPLRKFLNEYIYTLGAIPPTKTTVVDLRFKSSIAGDRLDAQLDAAIAQGAQHLDSGGIVQGRRGSPQLVVAHGGETVLPTHRMALGDALPTGDVVTNNIYLGAGATATDVALIERAVNRANRRRFRSP